MVLLWSVKPLVLMPRVPRSRARGVLAAKTCWDEREVAAATKIGLGITERVLAPIVFVVVEGKKAKRAVEVPALIVLKKGGLMAVSKI